MGGQVMNIVFHKTLTTSRLAEHLLASQGVLLRRVKLLSLNLL